MPSPLISAVIVTWNGKRYVQECLSSLQANNDLPLEVIAVDNASTDGTPELIAEEFPNTLLIRNLQNLGFAKGNNIGIRQSQGKYVCLINSDVSVTRGCLHTLFQFMETHPNVGIAGPQMLDPDNRVRRSSMRFPSVKNSIGRALAVDRNPHLSRLTGGQMMSDFGHSQLADVEVLNGWFWIIRREAMEQVGLLDEGFFIYGEDLDWCYRFRKAGWRVVFYPKASAIHYGGASSSAAPVRFFIEMQKANLQYWKKHHSLLGWSAYYLVLLTHHVFRLIYYGSVYLIDRTCSREKYFVKLQRSGALLMWMVGAR